MAHATPATVRAEARREGRCGLFPERPHRQCTLRLIEETVEGSCHGQGRNSRQYVFDQLYEEKRAAPLVPGLDGRQAARVEFQLPEGDYSTRLSADEPPGC